MSRYRSELDVLLLRIDALEERLRAMRREQIRLEAPANLGPQARRPFSRAMYRFGRGVRRILRRRGDASSSAVDAARERLTSLEHQLAGAEVSLREARATAAAARDAVDVSSHRSTASALDTAPAPRPEEGSGWAYAVGRALRRMLRVDRSRPER